MRRLLAVPLLLALATACSSGGGDEPAQPDPTAFAEGTCRTVAEGVLELGRVTRGLDTDEAPSPEARDALRTAQEGVAAGLAGAEPALTGPLQDLVTSVGLARVQADTGRFSEAARDRVLGAYDAVVTACTAPQ